MNLTTALVIILAVSITTGAALGYFLLRLASRPVVNPLGSPLCDRCGKGTGKPWLWRNTRTQWFCNPCEQEVTDLMFDGYARMAEQQDKLLRLRAGLPQRDEPTA